MGETPNLPPSPRMDQDTEQGEKKEYSGVDDPERRDSEEDSPLSGYMNSLYEILSYAVVVLCNHNIQILEVLHLNPQLQIIGMNLPCL